MGRYRLQANLFFKASLPKSTSLPRKFLATGSFGLPTMVSIVWLAPALEEIVDWYVPRSIPT
jgi:hypothetical protein